MSLSAWEQQALDSIKEGLARSDPRLVALLATFTRLVSDEEMPVRERIRAGSGRTAGHRRRRPAGKSHRYAGLMRHRRRGFQRAPLLLYLLITAALIVTGVVLSRGSSHSECPSLWAVPCASSTPARSSRPAAPKGPASQAPDQQVRAQHTGDRGSHG
jgi:hypothetical protein